MKLRRGFSLLELIVGCFVMVMFMGILVEASSFATAFFKKAERESNQVSDFRHGFELLANDIKESEGIMVGYPTNTPIYRTNMTDTIVVRIPRFDSDNNRLPRDADIKIYRFESATGANGPNVLRVYTATISSGVEGAVSNRGILATNITHHEFVFHTTQFFFGDQSRKTFALSTEPLAIDDASEAMAPQVLIGGKNRLEDGWAEISGTSVVFDLAPRWNVPIDIRYPVDPTLPSNDRGVGFATMVDIIATVKPKTKNRNHSDSPHEADLSTRVSIWNR